MSTLSTILDHYFEPVVPMFNREIAQAIISQKPDPRMATRIAELGVKSSDGTLSDAEREEYKELVDAGDVISLIKSKARRFLDENPG